MPKAPEKIEKRGKSPKRVTLAKRSLEAKNGRDVPRAGSSLNAGFSSNTKGNFKGTAKNKDTEEDVSFLPSEDDPDFLQVFRNLINSTPRDANGFLNYFYDATMIPPDLNDRAPNKREPILIAARTKLSMLEGYHSIDAPNPLPVWSKLPFEPKAYYDAFRSYLLSPSRSLATTGNDIDFEVPGFTPFTLKEAYTLFYWSDRSRAYDLQKPVAAARLRDQRLLQTEDAHYLLTNTVISQLTGEIEQRSNDSKTARPWEGLKSSEIITALTSMMQMQRVSLGLPSHGPKIKNEGFQPAQHAGIERNIREAAQNYMGTTEAGLTQAEQMQQSIDRTLAEDPRAAATLQDVAISIMLKARNAQIAQISQSKENESSDGVPQGYGPPKMAE